MPEIMLQKPRSNDEDVCCRCGIPKRIGCHHDKQDRSHLHPEWATCPFCGQHRVHISIVDKALNEDGTPGTKRIDYETIEETCFMCERTFVVMRSMSGLTVITGA